MGFGFVALCYLIALIAVSFCIFFAIYTVICIDELKTDYKNPISQCDNLNKLILPEYAIQIVFTFLFICSVQLFAIVWNLPLAGYHIYRYIHRPIMREPGIYDPTTILNNDELKKANREGWCKLGFYLISFFYYLYAMIYTLVST
ncbi:unnamed protein product [Bursaphelenchus okinawaensis]|uniref:Protein cornichon n=1 Tax=Bursaphelenchus okinawaensis TaxID=465554 RepID=A0A811LDC7_9BILA|nr:unnamed protein product [Bursaphelenchus okinawaensis]CAG9120427.1 unnamed protein product [Bursaphelenchus okinawaensis]